MVIYVDLDAAVLRPGADEVLPVTRVVRYVRDLHERGHELFGWSRFGAAYAREVAQRVEVEGCFVSFLPRPEGVVDGEPPERWPDVVTLDAADVGPGRLASFGRGRTRTLP